MAEGVTFTDGQQVKGASENAFQTGQMQGGGPMQGPLSDGDKSTDVRVDGEMPSRAGSPLESPVDNY